MGGAQSLSSQKQDLHEARSNLRQALDALQTRRKSIDLAGVVGCLQEVDAAMQKMDDALQQKRRPAPSMLRRKTLDAAGAGALQDYMLQTFTRQDQKAEGVNSELNSEISTNRKKKRAPVGGAHLEIRQPVQEDLERMMSAYTHKLLATPRMTDILSKAGTFGFNALELAEGKGQGKDRGRNRQEPLIPMYAVYVLEKTDMLTNMTNNEWISDSSEFSSTYNSFMRKIDKLYKPDVIYHNSAHAVSVMSTVDWLMRSKYVSGMVSTLDHFLALTAAAIHDVAHPGTTANFHLNTMSPLAIQFNDRSVLENMHCATAFGVIGEDDNADWLDLVKPSFKLNYVRKCIIDMVLATDMTGHKKHSEKFAAFVEQMQGEDAETELKRDDKWLLLETILHAADLSSVTRPPDQMLVWSQRILQEFWKQGDTERELTLPISPLCDRVEGVNSVATGQLFFSRVIVQPLFISMRKLIEEVEEALATMRSNEDFWEQKGKESASFEAIFGNGPEIIP